MMFTIFFLAAAQDYYECDLFTDVYHRPAAVLGRARSVIMTTDAVTAMTLVPYHPAQSKKRPNSRVYM